MRQRVDLIPEHKDGVRRPLVCVPQLLDQTIARLHGPATNGTYTSTKGMQSALNKLSPLDENDCSKYDPSRLTDDRCVCLARDEVVGHLATSGEHGF